MTTMKEKIQEATEHTKMLLNDERQTLLRQLVDVRAQLDREIAVMESDSTSIPSMTLNGEVMALAGAETKAHESALRIRSLGEQLRSLKWIAKDDE
jgi:hypothetical protein